MSTDNLFEDYLGSIEYHSTDNSRSITLSKGNCSLYKHFCILDRDVRFISLPTEDPQLEGAVWVDKTNGNVLRLSAGPKEKPDESSPGFPDKG